MGSWCGLEQVKGETYLGGGLVQKLPDSAVLGVANGIGGTGAEPSGVDRHGDIEVVAVVLPCVQLRIGDALDSVDERGGVDNAIACGLLVVGDGERGRGRREAVDGERRVAITGDLALCVVGGPVVGRLH